MKQFYIKSAAAIAIIIVSVLIGLRLISSPRSLTQSGRTVRELTAMLSEGNVHISRELLDMEEHTVYDCTMVSSIDTVSLAKQFLGRTPKKVSDEQYTSPEGTFTVTGSRFAYTPNTPRFSADTRSISVSTAVGIALRLCDEYGIDYADAETELSSSRDGFYVSIMKTLDRIPMFNDALVMDLHADGLHSVSGVDFRIKSGTEQTRSAKDISSALTEFMRDCTDRKRETIITDLKLGYLLEDADSTETRLKPVWRIIVENSSVYYIDA